MSEQDNMMRFVDVWTLFNIEIENLCKKRRCFIVKIMDESTQMIDEEDVSLLIESTFDNLELRIQRGANDTSKWPDFGFLTKQRGENVNAITKERFNEILKEYLKNKSIMDHLESFLPKAIRLITPMNVQKKKIQSTLTKFTKPLPPIEETAEDDKKEDSDKNEETQKEDSEEEEIPIKKRKRTSSKTAIEIPPTKNANHTNVKETTKKQPSNKLLKKAKHTRCGLFAYQNVTDKKKYYHPIIMRKDVDDEDIGTWFKLNITKDKLEINEKDEFKMDLKKQHPESLDGFAIEGPIIDEVPNSMIEYFVRSVVVRRRFKDDRKDIYKGMEIWLTKAQKVKWKAWSNQDWEDEYLYLF